VFPLVRYLLTDRVALDLRTTTYIITNLLYVSPKRNLLYVTDTTSSTFGSSNSPTHVFEHLSCFLPGLLALGAHTLPLDNLAELGIIWDHLGNETTYGQAGRNYQTLKKYNLKDLHMWAAEGIAQTCWATYADQPTGLGPDEIMMDTILVNRTETSEHAAKRETFLWIDAVEKWRKSGRRGLIPGLKDPVPMMPARKKSENNGRDYYFRRPGYLLRPEVGDNRVISKSIVNAR